MFWKVNSIKRFAQVAAVGYSLTEVLVALVWIAAVWRGFFDLLLPPGILWAMFVVRGAIMVFTRLPWHGDPRALTPLVRPTPLRVRAGMLVVMTMGLACVSVMTAMVLVGPQSTDETKGKLIYTMGLTIAATQSMYYAIHWAFLPENIFSRHTMDLLHGTWFPLNLLVYGRSWLKRRRRRAALRSTGRRGTPIQ